ncbi:uncharacterized protein LOC135094004 [Scylla paramamosain]|uniref:uncharacterized protein LOC135094004 n=1 Tax=Scylla paramamosain TaxID=85552 RepID=UPI00308323D6
MRRVSPCSLLPLLLLLALSPGNAPSPTLAQDCSAADMVVKEGQPQVINTTQVIRNGERYEGHLTLFLKPESDFEGVRLDVQASNGTHHTAWFPAEEECFPRDGTWREFEARTWKTENGFYLGFMSGRCWKECWIKIFQISLKSLSVVAYGPSRWRNEKPPKGCSVTLVRLSLRIQLPVCQVAPSTTTRTTNATTTIATTSGDIWTSKPTHDNIIIIALSAVVVLVMVVLVAVVVVFCKKRRSMPLPNEVRFQPEPAVVSRPLQSASGQGGISDQYQEGFYYQILPDHSAHRVMVSQPVQSQPAVPSRRLRFTHGQERIPDQDEEHIYYEIMPDLSARRVVVPRLSHDDVLPELAMRLRSPFYENVSPAGGGVFPHGHLEAPGVRGSHLYATVL